MSRASNNAESTVVETPENVEDQKQETINDKPEAETTTKSDGAEKTHVVKVAGNDTYCGVGAGGVQFANGKAENVSPRMAEWFRAHPGYEVTEA